MRTIKRILSKIDDSLMKYFKDQWTMVILIAYMAYIALKFIITKVIPMAISVFILYHILKTIAKVIGLILSL